MVDKKDDLGTAVDAKNDMSADMVADTNDKPTRFIGFVIVFLVFGVFGGWAAFAPLDSAALAPGVVAVEGNRKTVQHLEGGIIKQIFVKDGDKVSEGDSLVLLDDTQARAELQILRGQLFVILAQEARLLAERDELKTIGFPEELNVDDVRAREAMSLEAEQFKVRRASVEGEISVLRQRVEQLNVQADGLRALVKSKRALVRSYDEEIKDNEELLSEGFVDKLRLRDLQRNKEGKAGEIAEHTSSVASVTVQIGETELQILQLNKNFRTEVVNQLTDVQARLFDVRERIAAVSDRVGRAVIKAPVGGVVLGLSFHTLGGVIAPGKPILDIVPEDTKLLIEAQVSPMDIDRVSIGLTSDVRFSAFKSAITPVVEGTVERLSPDRLVNEDGTPYYLARIRLSDSAWDELQGLALVPGMPAEVLINTGSRTLFEYLVQPATNAFARSMIED